MALKYLFSVTDDNSISYDVKFDDVTLQVSVWDAFNNPANPTGVTNPNFDLIFASTDSDGVPVYFIGVTESPYAAFPAAGIIVGDQCYGFDLYHLLSDGEGRGVQGDLKQANSTSCGYVPAVFLDVTVINAVCFGSTSGYINIEPSNGVAPYTYLWSDGSTEKDRASIPAGTYSVTATDSVGTTGTANNIVVGQNTEIVVTGEVSAETITLNVSGGVAPYTYLWSDGSTEKNRTGLVPGFYSVTVTDSAGCQKSFSFNLFDAGRFYFSGNPVLLELQAEAPETKPNLTFLCEVWVEKQYMSGNFERVAELEHPADQDGSTRFDASYFLRPYLKPFFPEPGNNLVTQAESAFKRFYLRHTEKFGSPPVPSNFSVEENRYVVLGGLGFEDASRLRFFNTYLNSQQPFFNWQPKTIQATPEQPEYLYLMLHQAGITGFQVHVRTTTENGLQSVILAHEQNSVNRFELFCIPAGFNQLNLDSSTVKWEVWATDQDGNRITETRTYLLDARYARRRRYFLYANSLGGISTLVSRSEAMATAEVQSELMEKMLLPGYNPEQGSTEVVDAYLQETLQLSSCYLDSQEELQALRDFVLSREVRLLENGRYLSGTVKAKQLTTLDESGQERYLDFEFTLPLERHFTPEL